MTQMVRKQIYIQKRQKMVLKRLAKMRGLSEAEIIRQAIDREAAVGAAKPLPTDPSALQEFIKFAVSRRAYGSTEKGRMWRRDDLYEERLVNPFSGDFIMETWL